MRAMRRLRIGTGGNGVTYLVNSIFYTLQGEGYWTGRAAVFVRFSRCNLWTGREEDRETAICKFCDTDFASGYRCEEDELVEAVENYWIGNQLDKMVVMTGGEPAIQLRSTLVEKLRALGFYVAVETNGTLPLPPVDWVCLSPKAGSLPEELDADEIKLVFPQPDLMPYDLESYGMRARHFWISPMDGPNLEQNTKDAIKYVLDDTMWRLNIQTHKVIGVK